MGPKTYFIKKWNNNKNSTQPTLQKEKEKRYEKKEQKELQLANLDSVIGIVF